MDLEKNEKICAGIRISRTTIECMYRKTINLLFSNLPFIDDIRLYL